MAHDLNDLAAVSQQLMLAWASQARAWTKTGTEHVCSSDNK